MDTLQTATLAGGCFWCTEAIFRRLKGVSEVAVGYSGGQSDSPNYDEVSAGESGHAESIQLQFDPGIISYADLLRIFFHLHDPTTLNRQGPDEGTEYRSIIFFHDEEQHETALAVKAELSPEFSKPIVTEITPFKQFFPAEQSHQEYYEKHTDAPYCQLVVAPKVQKLLEKYSDRVRPEYRIAG